MLLRVLIPRYSQVVGSSALQLGVLAAGRFLVTVTTADFSRGALSGVLCSVLVSTSLERGNANTVSNPFVWP